MGGLFGGGMEPPVTEASGPFWEATKQKKLVGQWCAVCKTPIQYPREACPSCLGTDLEWRPAAGTGEVYARIVVHDMGDEPYVVGLVNLDEGHRLMTNIVNCDPAETAVGMRVRVTWKELSDGRNLPLFEKGD